MFKSVNIKLEECEEDITVSEDVPVIPSFKKMGLNTDLLHGIYEYGELMYYSLVTFAVIKTQN